MFNHLDQLEVAEFYRMVDKETGIDSEQKHILLTSVLTIDNEFCPLSPVTTENSIKVLKALNALESFKDQIPKYSLEAEAKWFDKEKLYLPF